MGERRMFDAMTDRQTFSRRMRILRHRTARWFLPPVRQAVAEPPPQMPRLRVLPSAGPRRNGPLQ
jgi:hypothetical protein